MDYENISQLISDDKDAMHYFNSLPVEIQQKILDRGTGVSSLEQLKSFQQLVENGGLR